MRKRELITILALTIFLFLMAGVSLFNNTTVYAAGFNTGQVAFKITIDAPNDSKNVKLWVPYPVSDENQKIEDVKINGNYGFNGIFREPETGNMALYAEWKRPVNEIRYLTFSFKVSSSERSKRNFISEESILRPLPPEARQYLKATHFIPIDGKVREIALRVTKGKKTVVEKARAVYDWVVENTFRDPNVQGCGIGDVERTLAIKGGKCVDISSVFVAVARAAGVPAREVFGLRLAKKDGVSDLTKNHHCWLEFYAPRYGWVPADPADVTKFVFANKISLEEADSVREYYFGGVDSNRVTLAKGGRGYYLNPRQADGPLNYFMYPYAEVDGKALEWLAAQNKLKYKITYNKIAP